MATGTVRIEGQADLRSLNAAVDKLGDRLRTAKTRASSFGASLKTAGRALAPLGGAALAAVAGMAALADKTLRARLETASLAEQSNISAKLMGTLQVSAERAGVSADQVTGSMKALTVAAYEASRGNADTAAKFAELGVSVTDAAGNLRSTEAIFRDVIGGLGEVDSATERTARAQVLMGEGAAGLTAALGTLSDDGLARAERASRAFTGHLDSEGIAAARDYEAQLNKLAVVTQSVGDAFSDLAGPTIGFFIDNVAYAAVFVSTIFTEAFDKLGDVINIQAKRLANFGEAARALATGGPAQAVAVLEAGEAAISGLEQAAGLSKNPLENFKNLLVDSATEAERVVAALNDSSAALKRDATEQDKSNKGKRRGKEDLEEFNAEIIQFADTTARLLEYNAELAPGFGALTASALEYGAALGTVELQARNAAAAQREQEQTGLAALTGLVDLTGKAADAFGEYISQQENAPQALKAAYKAMFALNKAAAVASAVVNTALSITAALTVPPPAGPVLAGVNAAAGAVQVATILAEQPSFASGGIMPSTGGAATLHPGEAVISAGAVDSLGGATAIASANARSSLGGMGGGGGAVVVQWKHLRQSFSREVDDAARRPGPMRRVRRDGRRAGQTARSYRPDYGAL